MYKCRRLVPVSGIIPVNYPDDAQQSSITEELNDGQWRYTAIR